MPSKLCTSRMSRIFHGGGSPGADGCVHREMHLLLAEARGGLAENRLSELLMWLLASCC